MRFLRITAGLCVASSLLALSLAVVPALAEPDERGAAETEALVAAQQEYDAAQEQLSQVGSELESTQVEISKLEDSLEGIEADIVQTQADIESTTAELESAQEALATYLQINYKMGSVNLLDVLLSSASFNDYETRAHYVTAIQNSQVETINEIRDLKELLEEQKAELAAQQTEESELLAELETREAELTAKKEESDAIVASLSAEVQELFAAQQAELTAAAQARSYAAGAADAATAVGLNVPRESMGSVVDNAYACLGIPYQWGGDDDNVAEIGGYDCSGFVQHCYALEGYSIGRTTWDQIADIQNAGNWKTSIEELVPGDLVFPNEGHVGIYIGNNQMIDAPYPGMYIRIDDITDFIGGGSPV